MSDQNQDLTTREKILAVALQHFNEYGVPNVTTAAIAKSIEISEGNLWYHFRTKRDLIEALFVQLETAVDANLSRTPRDNAALSDHLDFLARAYQYLWDFRFIFRDRLENWLDDNFRERNQQLIHRGQENAARILNDMIENQILSASQEAARPLAINAWILHTNWINFLQARENLTEITSEHIKEGFAQMIWLFDPYWSDGARREAENLLANFSLADVKRNAIASVGSAMRKRKVKNQPAKSSDKRRKQQIKS